MHKQKGKSSYDGNVSTFHKVAHHYIELVNISLTNECKGCTPSTATGYTFNRDTCILRLAVVYFIYAKAYIF